MGENIYQFAYREMPGAALRAWRLEADRLQRQNKSVWHFENEILQALCLTSLIYGTLIGLYGLDMVVVLIPVAIWGAFQLTSALRHSKTQDSQRQLRKLPTTPLMEQQSFGF
jgi:alkane 1-monooxygenase